MHPILHMATAIAALACAAPAHAQSVYPTQTGSSGSVSLNAGFTPDPYGVTVTAGGPVAANTLGEGCYGFISTRASFTLNYQAGSAPLIVSATSAADTVLAVRAPSGAWSCDDDTDRLNPVVRFETPTSGRYQIWVGTFGDQTAQAMLNVSEVRSGPGMSAEAPNFGLDPAFGAAYLVSGFEPDPHEQEIAAGGSYDAAQLQDGCLGYVSRAPDYRVIFTAGSAGLPLIFSVSSVTDATLVINEPGGTWVCNDDGGEGLNPSIRFDTPVTGQYDIWVGTFAQTTLQPSLLHVSELTSQ